MEDLELLNRHKNILSINKYPEKIAKFKTAKSELYRQFKEVNEDTFIAFETRLDSKDEIIEGLKETIDRYTHDLSQYMALAEALNDRAIEMARLAISLGPIPPNMDTKKPRLSLVKA